MRRLANLKRVSLEGLVDGWGSDCYALVVPATYAEYIEIIGLGDQGKSKAELFQYEVDFVKAHLVSGKVNVLNDKNQMVLDDLLPEDVAASREIGELLFNEIVGVNPDPKASSSLRPSGRSRDQRSLRHLQ